MDNELIKEIKGVTYHFKFKSKKLVDLEKLTGKSIIELLQDVSMQNIARLLKYACLEQIDEYELLDNLLEEMTYEEIISKVILETCAVSGLISKTDLNNLNAKAAERKDDLKN